MARLRFVQEIDIVDSMLFLLSCVNSGCNALYGDEKEARAWIMYLF
jgi:hypothetical protein